MNKIKNILCLSILILSLVSCGDKSNSEKSESNVIRFWHFWSEPNQRAIIKELISEFESANDCKVEMTELSWGDGKTKLFAAFNAKNAPDVLELGSDWVAQFSSSSVLHELNPDSVNINKFIDFSLSPCYYENKLYALPWIVDTRVLFFNKDLVQAGSEEFDTYEKLAEIASKINNKNTYGWGANGSDRHRLYKKIVSFFWTYGGDILDDSGNPVINSAANIAALEMYSSLSRYGIIETQRQLDASFTEGKTAFWLSGGWLIEKIKNENPNLNYGVSLVPGTGDSEGISFGGGEYLAINANSGNKELAEELIKFLTDGKNSIRFCKAVIEAGFPADKQYYQDDFYNSQEERLVFAKQLEKARMTPIHPKWLDIETIIEDAAVETMYGKASAAESLNAAQLKVLEIIK
ncbi:MAG: extracellular solute-binding protein [Candidatus Kapaibacterium sp.]